MGVRPGVQGNDCWRQGTHAGLHRTGAGEATWGRANGGRVAYSLDRLTHTIEGEIIPRLLLAHGLAAPEPAGASAAQGGEDAVTLAKIAVDEDLPAALAFIGALRAKGAPLDLLLLDLLAPAARHLGELWETDQCDFAQVTIGLSRLQQVLRELSPAFENEVAPRAWALRGLLFPAPGEQHTFGIYMVEEFLRRDGWDVMCGPAASSDEIADVVGGDSFALIGFSLSCESRLEALASCIRAARRASLNRDIYVMVGGRVFTDHAELAVLAGADATASDAREAVLEANGLVRPGTAVR